MAFRKMFIVVSDGYKKVIIIFSAALIFIILFYIIPNFHKQAGFINGKNIIIDPGHGGIDGGTNDGSTFLEKDINLQITKILQEILVKESVNVDLTRDSDISLDGLNNSSESRHARDLQARVDIFNTGKYDIFLSIHVNRSSNANALGPLVLYSPTLPNSRILAEKLQTSLNKLVKEVYNRQTNRIPVSSNFYILKNAKCPGVIIETGFISNPVEKKLLKDPHHQEKLSIAIIEGVREYFKSTKDYNLPRETWSMRYSPQRPF